jgi:hypothetical protein
MKPLNEQINPKFIAQAKKLRRVSQLLHNILPIECRNHVQVANVRQKILMLVTDSPAWTTRLRQLSPRILQYINDNRAVFKDFISDDQNSQLPLIHHVQISTRYQANNTATASSLKTTQKKPEISDKTAELISQSANSIQHQELKTALLKLASHRILSRKKNIPEE